MKHIYINESLTQKSIWLEMLSRGFYIPRQSYITYMETQEDLGWKLVNEHIPRMFRTYLDAANNILNEVERNSPLLWQRLSGSAAFGYTQGKLIHRLWGGAKEIEDQVALKSCIFNLGISLFDFILDELDSERKLLKTLDVEFIVRALDNPEKLEFKSIKKNNNDSIGNLIIFLFLLVNIFFKECWRLHCAYSTNKETWEQFGKLIVDLYESEINCAKVKLHDVYNHQVETNLLSQLQCKSARSSQVISTISKMTIPDKLFLTKKKYVEIACDTLGDIFWIVDDLADFVKDLNRSIPSFVTLKVKPFLIQEREEKGESFEVSTILALSVEALYHLMSKLDRDLNCIPLLDKTVHHDVVEFMEMYTYAWLSE